MPEEIRPDFFRIRVPLPDSPLKYLNSYVIRSTTRHLVIDTGLNREECRSAMMAGLEELDVDLADTDFFITHLHADHFGLVGRLATDSSRIFFNRPEAELIESWSGWEPMIAFAAKNGFPEDELRLAIQSHPGHKFGSEWVPDVSVMKDGDRINAGPYSFQCLFTPGHSMGHMCLYEPVQKILVAGDHILVDITPNIQCWSDSENPLKRYLESLDRVNGLDIVLTLPAHRRLIGNPADRIRDLRAHHSRRLTEVVAILEKGPQHAYQVASQMNWDLKAESWEAFPRAQKWFATGEALAHLRYLEDTGSVVREPKSAITCFTLNRAKGRVNGRTA
jgi:glyoxylase-like metal-dependent hydrolase (beta-lactamase superfamily II)